MAVQTRRAAARSSANRYSRLSRSTGLRALFPRQLFSERRPLHGLCFESLRICGIPHIRAATKYANPYRQAQPDVGGVQMRALMLGIAVVVAIGLIWSVAAMSNLVPVDGSDSAAIARPAE
jgi:hypothetical protein